MKTLVVGLGNPILGDDGVGWRVAAEVRRHLEARGRDRPSQVEVDCHAGGGLSLMERLAGYDRAIVVDAIRLRQQPVGSVRHLPLAALPNPCAGHLASAHETDLQTALRVGRAMHVRLPADITVVAIEADNVFDFSEALTPAVAAAVPRAVERVLALLEE